MKHDPAIISPDEHMPRYPVYVPSKGRFDNYTAKCLVEDRIPFRLVVEEQEADEYAKRWTRERLLILPFKNKGLFTARNWIKQHSIDEGHARHWQIDDNILYFFRRYKGRREYCEGGPALRVCEDLTDRYDNVAISGLNYGMFALDTGTSKMPPFYVNNHVYSCSLVNNAIPHGWRLRYNDDTDICLQVLADGWCTILLNAFLIQKVATMKLTGGNTTDLYQGDGRLKMARSLERVWPGVVQTSRRFKRPQHVVAYAWRKFDTKLKLRPGVDLAALAANPSEYGLVQKRVKPERKTAKRPTE